MCTNIQSFELQNLKEIERDLSHQLTNLRTSVLEIVSSILNMDVSVCSLHGTIGGKNNTFVDSVRTQFPDFEVFFAKWIHGLRVHYEFAYNYNMQNYGRIIDNNNSAFKIVNILKNPIVLEYTRLFLERNFYRQLEARTRLKPDEQLWSLWFGNELLYGILIAPINFNGNWKNDKSEIRRTKYQSWTVGHIMDTGLIISTSDKPYKFSNITDFKAFYLNVLSNLSKSEYEKEFHKRYIEYLDRSIDPLSEPLLIPELRYGGMATKHLYRLDFTILNAYTSDFIGFEISPASSHMSISGLVKKQYAVNEELKEKWMKEMNKRNDYFSDFGITTITFTDDKLSSIDDCFQYVQEILGRRNGDISLFREDLTWLSEINSEI